MTRRDRQMVQRNLDLAFEFERYVAAHPRAANKIPEGAVLVFQVRGDETFNRWSRRLGERHTRQGQHPLLQITINRMGPVRSRIEALKIERAA